MNRKLGRFESMLFTSDATIVGCVELEGSLFHVDIFQRAVQATSRKHPLLRCNITEDEDNNLYITELVNYAVGVVFTETHDWQQLINDQMREGLNVGAGDEPLWRVHVISCADPPLQKILITIHHCISDGLSLITMIQSILSFYSEISTDTSSLPLLANIEDIYFTSHQRDEQKETIASESRVDRYLKWKPVLQFDKYNRNAFSRWSRALFRTGSKENLKLLQKRSREEGVTIGSVLAACLYTQVVRSVATSGPSITFPLDVDVDLRNMVEPKLNLEHVGLLIGIMQIDVTITNETRFWDLCRTVQSTVRAGLKEENPAYYLLSNDHVFSNNEYINHLDDNCGRVADINLSNIGKFPYTDPIGSYRVTSFHGITSQSEGWTYLFAISSVESLCYSWVYESSLVREETASQLFNSIVDMVETCHTLQNIPVWPQSETYRIEAF